MFFLQIYVFSATNATWTAIYLIVKKKIIINEKQALHVIAGNNPQKMRNSADDLVQERYLYHSGDVDNLENPTPHYSEARWQKFEGSGHETGSFGSGMYFTSAHPRDNRWYRDDYTAAIQKRERGEGPNKNFIKIGDALYCVDTDFYKNLYVIKSETEAEMLESLMEAVNSFVRTFNWGDRASSSYKETRWRQYRWLQINNIANKLGIGVPWDYRGMCEFAKWYCSDQSIRPTPATIFMEKNGFNGVDATYGGKYDSYWQGSVIYDLSKVEQHMEPVLGPRDEMRIRFGQYERNLEDSIYDDNSKYRGLASYNKDYDYRRLDDPDKVLIALKRYRKILPAQQFWGLPEDLKSKYLDILYINIKNEYVDVDPDRAFYNSCPSIKDLCKDIYINEIISLGKTQFINLDESLTYAIVHKLAYGYGIDKNIMRAFVNAYKGNIAQEFPDEWDFIQDDLNS